MTDEPHDLYDPLVFVRPASARYIVLVGTYMDIQTMVANHIEAGWNPQGGVAVLKVPDQQPLLYQAMVHPDPWQGSKVQIETGS